MIFTLLVAVVFCLLVSGLFSGIEAGILSINRVRLRYQVKLREKTAIKLQKLLLHPERLLVTVLLVTNFMNICAVAISTRALVRWLGVRGYPLAFIFWLPVYLGVALLPKSIFRRFPYRALVAFVEVLRIIYWLLSPVLGLGSMIYNFFASKHEYGFKKIFTAREDFKYIISENEKTGAVSRIEREMIDNVVDFHGITAREVMSPIADVPSINHDASVDELVAISRNSHLDQLPVIAASGEITGQVNIFEVLLDLKNSAGNVGAYVRRIVTIPPDEPAYSIIRKLRAARSRLAVVTGANASPVGIVSSEALIKRLFGTGS
jgi:CBS domain containing-hemolysin-like protein